MSDDDILFARRGRLGVATLNRPEALNALTLEMAERMSAALAEWAGNDAIDAVLVKGAGERAFCAGGDIRRMYDVRGSGDRYPYDFFRTEYTMNARVFHFPKPYMALMDGIVMGGGVGLSVHGSHRIASERMMLAMPETGIGLFPDVGGSYFLPRLPGEIGMFMALTGARVRAADALALGVADVFVPSERLRALEAELAEADLADGAAAVDRLLAAFAGDPGAATLTAEREAVDACFSAGSVEEIIERLRGRGGEWAERQLGILAGKSPTSLKVTFEQMRRGAGLDLDACMAMEYRIANGCVLGHDFYEGIRAVVVDKDQKPAWRPSSLAEVSEADVAAYFERPPFEGDLDLSAPI
jgi:enoyl-CoA hydratase/carnithine racemase